MKRVDKGGPVGRGLLWRSRRAGGPALPGLESAPVLTGAPVIGQALACTTGVWSGTGTLSYARQWMRGGAAIGGASGATYVPTAADDLSDVSCVVTATDANGSRSAASNAVGVTYAAPVAAGGVEDRIFMIGEAIGALDVEADFTGEALSFALAPSSAALPAGLALSSAGVITGTPTAITALRTIVVRGANSGGFDDTGFAVTVAEAPAVPVLSSFGITEAPGGSGSMALAVDMDCTVHGWIGPAATTPAASEVRSGTGAAGTFTQAVTVAGGPYTITLPGGLNGNYRVSVVGQVGSGPLSNVETQSPVGFDTLGATLSSPTGTQTGETTADWSVASNEAGGVIHAGIRPAASAALTAAQLIAGAGGAGVAWSSDATPTADGANGGFFAGLTAATAYRVDIVQVDASGNLSGVVTSAAFSTAGAAPVFQALGVGTKGGSNTSWPAHAAGDIGILMGTSDGGTAAPATPEGWTPLGSFASWPAANSLDARTTLFYRVAGSGAENAAPTSGWAAGIATQILTVRGGSAVALVASGGARSASVSLPGGPVSANSLIVAAVGVNVSGSSFIDQIGSWSNADVTLTDRGGHVSDLFALYNAIEWATGPRNTAGTIGNTTATCALAQGHAGAILEITS